MTESHIGRLVHHAFQNETNLYADSVFNDQRFRGFFAQIKDVVNDCFQSLYDTVNNEYSDAEERRIRFSRGLDYIKSGDVTADELQRIKQKHPSIDLEYQRSFIRYAQSVSESNQKIKIPTFDLFLIDLYRRFSNSLEVKSGRYFRMSYLEQEVCLKDILRTTMSANIRFEEQPVQRDHNRVLPSDSASNITSHSRRNNNSVLDKALSAVRGGITEEELEKHKSRMSSKFKAPSVISRTSERVVSIRNRPDSPKNKPQTSKFFSSDEEDEDKSEGDVDF